ncbi:MAG: glycosyltransferase [Flavobacteriales bacterium]|nr:glycosyltransferase [Flavobacteriales bacterium]MCB9201080.1 glycosyltransferase [Flavobacteriales bacterium]
MSTFLILVLLVFLATLVHASVLGGWRDRLLRMEVTRPEPTSPGPSISVVVPARNAERTITFLLQDLHEQTLSKERYEVIVVDDASTDGTAARVRSMATRWPGLQVVPAEGQGKKAAITTGVGRARHAWVLVTDADVRCGRERLDVFARHLGATEDVLVGGPVRMTHRSGLPGTLQAEETAALQGATLGSGIGGRPVLLNGANMAFRKEVFERMGGYAGDRWASGDDVFLLERIVRHGGRAGVLPDQKAAVEVEPEYEWSGWWRQRLRWAGKMRGSRSVLGLVGGLAVLLLPWILLLVTARFLGSAHVGMGLLRSGALLVAAWLLWVVPVLRLVGAVKRTWHAPHRPLASLIALLAFAIYAPLIAIVSIFVRTTWKGRRV